ncbi:DUF305 domain-containing protein [Paraburkholderia bannensis]|uniref:DUF305 domain-containing protein n=1 Tax=Paraburkholderia bannensis TaxID=765414 RepID=UPI002ABDE515|nr:DUF305 domain-containing protein [Paraburkholderia bannensis]
MLNLNAWRRPFPFGMAMLMMLACCVSVAKAAGPTTDTEAMYLKENDAAMARMMNGMSTHPSGDVDLDFVAMMVPHHQGAIDMAEAELRYGKNEQLRRIAQEIVVEQQQEIVAMHVAIGQAPSSSSSQDRKPDASIEANPPASSGEAAGGHMRMSMEAGQEMPPEGNK